MADRPLKLKVLRTILKKHGVECSDQRGKGSHVLFFKQFSDGEYTYPVPRHGKDVAVCYVRGCRKKFRLRSEDGVSDDVFYGK